MNLFPFVVVSSPKFLIAFIIWKVIVFHLLVLDDLVDSTVVHSRDHLSLAS